MLRPGQGLANTAAPVPHPSDMEISFNKDALPDCMRFVKGLGGVTAMVIGINFLEEAVQDIKWAIETQPFNDTEMQAFIKMGEMVAPMWSQRYGAIVRMVTNSSADVGCTPSVRSKSALVAPMCMATAKPCTISPA